MNMKLWVLTVLALICLGQTHAQRLMGVVYEKDEKGKDQPLAGANVYWLGTTKGTTTRENGVFLLDRQTGLNRLVISYVGYKSDTITIDAQTNVKVELVADEYLQEVVVQGWKPTTHIDHRSGTNTIVMDEKELFKAACCNLSESFETNPSVDVAFTDAVTGTKQIQMLGLSGPNTMISIENMPGVRGLASSQGIQFVPGSWINSIQVTKGTGSVVNGYESIAGQINVELKKPQESDKVFANGYVNSSGRTELNLVTTAQVGKKWGTTLLLHGSNRPFEMDQNKDGFLDFPLGQQVNFVNRWVYNSGTGWLGQFAFKYLRDDKIGGQKGYETNRNSGLNTLYGLEINSERREVTGKLGYQFAGRPYKSIGLQLDAFDHMHQSHYNLTYHDAIERSFYGNLIYQSIIGSTQHKWKAGASLLVDDYQEKIDVNVWPYPISIQSTAEYLNRHEVVPGAFAEYSYDDLKKFSVIAGVRVDHHNLFGTFVVPRLNLKYNLTTTTTLRASAGRGVRVANLFIENPGFLASSRRMIRQLQSPNKAYGFQPDKAWNYGLNLSQEFTLNYRPGTLSVDYYFTNFESQVVADYDVSAREIWFHALNGGKSFSHSLQVQLDYQPVRRLDVRLAWRHADVQTDFKAGRLQRPLVPRDRAFLNVAFATKNNWRFDYTVQWMGPQRLPTTKDNPTDLQLPAWSDAYVLMNAQVSKDFGSRWSAYVGAENVGNFMVKNPIVAANDPFGPYFDTSMVWGPVFGRMWYGGFRYRIK